LCFSSFLAFGLSESTSKPAIYLTFNFFYFLLLFKSTYTMSSIAPGEFTAFDGTANFNGTDTAGYPEDCIVLATPGRAAQSASTGDLFGPSPLTRSHVFADMPGSNNTQQPPPVSAPASGPGTLTFPEMSGARLHTDFVENKLDGDSYRYGSLDIDVGGGYANNFTRFDTVEQIWQQQLNPQQAGAFDLSAQLVDGSFDYASQQHHLRERYEAQQRDRQEQSELESQFQAHQLAQQPAQQPMYSQAQQQYQQQSQDPQSPLDSSSSEPSLDSDSEPETITIRSRRRRFGKSRVKRGPLTGGVRIPNPRTLPCPIQDFDPQPFSGPAAQVKGIEQTLNVQKKEVHFNVYQTIAEQFPNGVHSKFRYDSRGHLAPDVRFTNENFSAFVKHHPLGRNLLFRLEKLPANCQQWTTKSDPSQNRCRAQNCIKSRKGFAVGTIRVAIDEVEGRIMRKDWHLNNPYFAAGYLHVDCLEEICDIGQLIRHGMLRTKARRKHPLDPPTSKTEPNQLCPMLKVECCVEDFCKQVIQNNWNDYLFNLAERLQTHIWLSHQRKQRPCLADKPVGIRDKQALLLLKNRPADKRWGGSRLAGLTLKSMKKTTESPSETAFEDGSEWLSGCALPLEQENRHRRKRTATASMMDDISEGSPGRSTRKRRRTDDAPVATVTEGDLQTFQSENGNYFVQMRVVPRGALDAAQPPTSSPQFAQPGPAVPTQSFSYPQGGSLGAAAEFPGAPVYHGNASNFTTTAQGSDYGSFTATENFGLQIPALEQDSLFRPTVDLPPTGLFYPPVNAVPKSEGNEATEMNGFLVDTPLYTSSGGVSEAAIDPSLVGW
jgi:hypothetical protein